MLKAVFSPQQPMCGTYFLQAVKVGALAKNRHGLRNARGKTAARALNAPVTMLAQQLHTVYLHHAQNFVMISLQMLTPFFFLHRCYSAPAKPISRYNQALP